MLVVVGCGLSSRERAGRRGEHVSQAGHEVASVGGVSPDNDGEYYENVFHFEELFQGHLRNVTGLEEIEPKDTFQGRLSPIIKLKLNSRIVN